MGEDGGVLSEDEARFTRFERALKNITLGGTATGQHTAAVVSDAMTLYDMAEGVGMQAMRAQAVYNAAIQPSDFLAKRIATSYPTIIDMVALVQALRLQVVIERME